MEDRVDKETFVKTAGFIAETMLPWETSENPLVDRLDESLIRAMGEHLLRMVRTLDEYPEEVVVSYPQVVTEYFDKSVPEWMQFEVSGVIANRLRNDCTEEQLGKLQWKVVGLDRTDVTNVPDISHWPKGFLHPRPGTDLAYDKLVEGPRKT